MIVTTELVDPEEASEVINHPAIYDLLVDDTAHDRFQGRIELPDDAIYAGGFVDKELASVSIAHLTERGHQYHFQCLPEYREHKYELGQQGMELIVPMCENVWCEIPDLYPEVYHFARKFGFREVEILKDHYVKNGERYDSRIMELQSWV